MKYCATGRVELIGNHTDHQGGYVLPPGVEENGLSLTLAEYRNKPNVAAVKLQGGDFGGSILVFERR